MSSPVLATPTNLTFRLDGQAGASYAICASTDLINWILVQSNTLASASANFTMDASAGSQFFRAQWSP
jgi:hypothetical protein